MFTTLRCNPHVGLQVDSERAAHQLSKRPACKHCQSKKLRCSRERHGCFRCASSGVICEYDTIRPKHRHRVASASKAICDNAIRAMPTTFSVPVAECQNQTAPRVVTQLLDDFTKFAPEADAENDLFNMLDLNFGDQLDGSLTVPSFISNSLEISQSEASSEDIVHAEINERPARESCHCLGLAVPLLETVSIQRIQGDLRSVPKSIQNIKNVLIQCRALLACNTCSKKSDFVMLLILVCEKIISSFQRIALILTEEYDRLHCPNRNEQVDVPVPRTESAIATAQVSEWRDYQIDVEDEPCVFWGLVQMQIKRITPFLRMLKEAAYHWPSHVTMLDLMGQDLKELLRTSSCSGELRNEL